jgi:hypothetical protein
MSATATNTATADANLGNCAMEFSKGIMTLPENIQKLYALFDKLRKKQDPLIQISQSDIHSDLHGPLAKEAGLAQIYQAHVAKTGKPGPAIIPIKGLGIKVSAVHVDLDEMGQKIRDKIMWVIFTKNGASIFANVFVSVTNAGHVEEADHLNCDGKGVNYPVLGNDKKNYGSISPSMAALLGEGRKTQVTPGAEASRINPYSPKAPAKMYPDFFLGLASNLGGDQKYVVRITTHNSREEHARNLISAEESL